MSTKERENALKQVYFLAKIKDSNVNYFINKKKDKEKIKKI